MTQLGCDTEQMAKLEDLFNREASTLTTAAERIDIALRRLPWGGVDARAFTTSWHTNGRASFTQAAAVLRASAFDVRRNRLEQIAASDAGTVTSGVGVGGAGTMVRPSTATAGARVPDGAATGIDGGSAPEPPGGWGRQAANRAGIDLAAWDPSRGATANADTIKAVYTYYGQLYLEHPELQWAGMANMIGPSFAAGFFDLAAMRDGAKRLADVLDRIPPPLRPPDLDGIRDLAYLSDADLHFYETTFLRMQREIFLDQASMHEAYLTGGIGAIERMQADGRIDLATVESWRQIDQGVRTGDQTLVAAGNRGLLLREQRNIIADDYDAMYRHQPTGPAMTYLMTLIGAPSIPGAHSFGEVFPTTIDIPTPGPQRLGTPDYIGTPSSVFGVHIPSVGVHLPSVSVDDPLQGTITVSTPFPDGNIAHFDDRWNLITKDTLPAYQALLRDPDKVAAIVSTNVATRIDANRINQRIDDIIAELARWDIGFRQ